MSQETSTSSKPPPETEASGGHAQNELPGSDEPDTADMPFSLRKPKDFKAGLSSGMKTIGKGVLAGAVGMPLTFLITERA